MGQYFTAGFKLIVVVTQWANQREAVFPAFAELVTYYVYILTVAW